MGGFHRGRWYLSVNVNVISFHTPQPLKLSPLQTFVNGSMDYKPPSVHSDCKALSAIKLSIPSRVKLFR